MLRLFALACLLGLGSCTTLLQDLMPTWEEFDQWLLDDHSRFDRLTKRSDPIWDNYQSTSHQTGDRREGVYDELVGALKEKEYIGAINHIAQHAVNLAQTPGPLDRQDEDIVVSVPQANVPQIVEDLGAMGPVVTIGYVLARDYQIQTQITNMKARRKTIGSIGIATSRATYSSLCSLVKSITSLQACCLASDSCSTAHQGCADTVVPATGTNGIADAFHSTDDFLNKLIKIGDPTCPTTTG